MTAKASFALGQHLSFRLLVGRLGGRKERQESEIPGLTARDRLVYKCRGTAGALGFRRFRSFPGAMASAPPRRRPMDDPQGSPAPLDGVRVLDLSRVLAGPLCTQILGDLGADVIKVERPGEGDDTRQWGPPFVGNDAAYFLSLNRNKRSIALDLRSPEGADVARRLARTADVVIENFRPGLMEDFGLDLDDLRPDNPGLVSCSLTAFEGAEDATRPGYDIIVQALSGLMSVTGEPGGEPTKVGVALLDVITGLYAAIGILAALEERRATGRGRHVTVSLYGASIAAMVNQAANYLLGGAVPVAMGSAHP